MVYLRAVIEENKKRLLVHKNIEQVAYHSLHSKIDIDKADYELSPEEEIAFCGYIDQPTDVENIRSIISKTPQKGVSAISNVYKLLGLFLAENNLLLNKLQNKFQQSELKQKYFITKFARDFEEQLLNSIDSSPDDNHGILIKFIYGYNVNEKELVHALENIPNWSIDIQLLILLEDIEKKLLQVKYINKSAEDTVRQILNNFSNAIKKITTNRRVSHEPFTIADEYDVQDILYVILKPIFPNLKEEDPIPKVGGKSTKIDLILREENILIETKMIKSSDKNERNFIEELKVDIESYHSCQWLKTLFFFVYDPQNKTRDLSNFTELNGIRTKNRHTFNVEVIILN